MALPTIPGFVYLPAMYGELLGLTAVGFTLLLARSLDLIADPVVGVLSDRFAPRWGRRKPWIVVGAILSGIAIVRLFQPPEHVTTAFFIAWSTLLYVGWTSMQVPYAAWGAELSTDYYQRARITAAREGATIIGIFAAGIAPLVGSKLGASEPEALAAMAWIAAIAGVAFVLLLVWRVPDPVPAPRSAGRPGTEFKSLWSAARQISKNLPFLRLVAGWFVNGLATGVPAVLVIYFMEHALEAGQTEWRLLLQLDSDERAKMMWGDAGRVSYPPKLRTMSQSILQ